MWAVNLSQEKIAIVLFRQRMSRLYIYDIYTFFSWHSLYCAAFSSSIYVILNAYDLNGILSFKQN